MNHITTIAGIPHRKPDLSRLRVGDAVFLVSEPTNKFDANAIKVMFSSKIAVLPDESLEDIDPVSVHLGYIPRMETAIVQGVPVMYIHKIEPSMKWKEVTIATYPAPEETADESEDGEDFRDGCPNT